MKDKMALSLAGLEFIKRWEGFRAAPYLDAAGIPTIGYGHTKGVGMHMDPITEERATELLGEDIDWAQKAVNFLVRPQLEQKQFDALVSFQFNTGGLSDSTLLVHVNNRDWLLAVQEFQRWHRAGGKALRGLLIRRLYEAVMFAEAS